MAALLTRLVFSRPLLVAAIAIGLCSSASADDALGDGTAERRWRAGVLLGVNISNAFGEECTLDCDLDLSMLGIEGFDPAATLRTSDHFTVGGFLTWRLNERYGLRFEARLSQKGVKAQHAAPTVLFDQVDGMDVPRFALISYTLEHKLRYMQVPIMVQMDIPYDNRFKPHVMAGLGFGYLWTADSTGEGNLVDAESFNTIGTVTGEGDTSDAASAFDLSVMLGADMVFPLSRGALEIGVRYELSVLSSLDGSFSNQLESSRPMYQPIAGSPDPSVELTSADFVAEGMRNSILSVIAGYRF